MVFNEGSVPWNKGTNTKISKVCEHCKKPFFSYPVVDRIFCSRKCYREADSTFKQRSLNGRITGMKFCKATDSQLLEAWNKFKSESNGKSLRQFATELGLKRFPRKRIMKLTNPLEYKTYAMEHSSRSGFNYRRGRRYEYLARKQLAEEGCIYSVRSARSGGIFDIWAVFPDHLKLIQIKATKVDANYSTLTKSLAILDYPLFCSIELWIWRDRAGWKRIVVKAHKKMNENVVEAEAV